MSTGTPLPGKLLQLLPCECGLSWAAAPSPSAGCTGSTLLLADLHSSVKAVEARGCQCQSGIFLLRGSAVRCCDNAWHPIAAPLKAHTKAVAVQMEERSWPCTLMR